MKNLTSDSLGLISDFLNNLLINASSYSARYYDYFNGIKYSEILLLLGLALFFSKVGSAYPYTIGTVPATNGATINTCADTFYDSGGSEGNYGNNQNFFLVFNSDNEQELEETFTTPDFRDIFCVEVCDDMGFYDTVIATVTVPLTSNRVENACITISTNVFLEGSFKDGSMHTQMNDLGYLPGQNPTTFFGIEAPVGQPYGLAPWNYFGIEGDTMDYTLLGDPKANYAPTVVDWVLVSLRTGSGTGTGTTVCQQAALLHDDGHIAFLEDQLCCDVDLTDSYYVVIEHRNHLIVMSHEPVPVNGDNTIAYDFRTQQSFRGLFGFGQKEITPGVFAMFAGNGEQINSSSSDTDINVGDKGTWIDENGDHSSYYLQDFDLNGDVNVQDKSLWLENNGKFSDVERN